MIIIDTELCEGCGDCAAACPEDCIGLEAEGNNCDVVAYIESEDCTQCRVCESVCPNGAIAVVET